MARASKKELAAAYARAPTGKSIIAKEGWADCEVCADAFAKRCQTRRYCAKCHMAFCPEHGTFTQAFGICIFCGRAKYKEAARRDRVATIAF